MSNGIKLSESGYEEYPLPGVLLENAAIAVWIALGTIISWRLHPAVGLLYLLFSIVMILVVMRKAVCTRCFYYGKRCHVGWGKISAALFDQGGITEFNACAGIKIAPVFYGLLALAPLLIGIISMVKTPSLSSIVLIAALVLVVFYSAVILRKKSCSRCKMKSICPGSAAK
jgi:hypothetical protein